MLENEEWIKVKNNYRLTRRISSFDGTMSNWESLWSGFPLSPRPFLNEGEKYQNCDWRTEILNYSLPLLPKCLEGKAHKYVGVVDRGQRSKWSKKKKRKKEKTRVMSFLSHMLCQTGPESWKISIWKITRADFPVCKNWDEPYVTVVCGCAWPLVTMSPNNRQTIQSTNHCIDQPTNQPTERHSNATR